MTPTVEAEDAVDLAGVFNYRTPPGFKFCRSASQAPSPRVNPAAIAPVPRLPGLRLPWIGEVAPSGMAKPSKLAHVVYMTRRFDEMLDWYKTVFEAQVQYQNPAFAFLTFDDEHHRFAFANMSVIAPAGVAGELAPGVGVNHVGYTYANLGELLETYARLRDLGITPYWRVHHGVTLSVYYRDPDGNRIEFQVDCCAGAEEAHDFMHSDTFAANPIGVEVDFELLLARYRDGMPTEVLLAQPEGPVSQIPPEHGLS